jgi:hypothetical protein
MAIFNELLQHAVGVLAFGFLGTIPHLGVAEHLHLLQRVQEQLGHVQEVLTLTFLSLLLLALGTIFATKPIQ